METSINGAKAEWSPEIWQLWHTFADGCDPKLTANGTVEAANYFTPRPYVDEYNRGSRETGFVYTLGFAQGAHRRVSQVIISRAHTIERSPARVRR